VVLVGGVALLVGVALAASLGGPLDPLEGVQTVAGWVVRAGWPPALWLVGAFGVGRLLARGMGVDGSGIGLEGALGLGLILWMSHLLGWGGVLLGGGVGLVVAWAPVVLGLGVVGVGVSGWWRARGARGGEMGSGAGSSVGAGAGWMWAWVAGAPALAVLVTASVSAPGWLWESEGGGYDALSYHLQLPKEWIGLGRIESLEHNVYSHLPSFVEASFAHVGAMQGHASVRSLLDGDGVWALSAQLLHMGMGLLAAWLTGRVASRVLRRAGVSGEASEWLGALSGVLVLATPWVVVTGSLAYNELAVCALFSGSLLVGLDERVSPWKRGAMCGVLVGAACGAKPTALVLVAPVVGLLLLATTPRRSWAALVGAGSVAGLVVLSPWLARNWVSVGNPVFPYATGMFGSGHWSEEQVSRFATHHSFEGGLVDRLRLMVFADAQDPAGTRHRGLLHPQWFVLFPGALMGVAIGLAVRATRRVALVIAVGLVLQLGAWLAFTHIQSRFLLPLIVTAGLGVAIGAGALVLGTGSGGGRRRMLAGSLVGLLVVAQTAQMWRVFARERGGEPNAALALGPGAFMGEYARDPVEATPIGAINMTLGPGEAVYLVGDARPFYVRAGHLYNTTWDAWPLVEAMERGPSPASWNAALRERGVTHAFVSLPELERLTRSGYADPGLTPEAVRAWVEESRVVFRWRETGELLLDLRVGGGR